MGVVRRLRRLRQFPEWLTEPAAPARVRSATASRSAGGARVVSDADPALREYLREWRRTMAREQGVAAFVVMHDTTLDEICRVQPRSTAGLRTITGIGERKAELYGGEVLAALERYREGARASTVPIEKKTLPALETMRLLNEGKSFEEIAEIRGRQLSTVINAVAALVEKGEIEFKPEWIDHAKQSVIEAGCAKVGGLDRIERLRTLKDVLPPEITYDEIRLVVAHLRRDRRGAIPA